jgi:hypothetical protein
MVLLRHQLMFNPSQVQAHKSRSGSTSVTLVYGISDSTRYRTEFRVYLLLLLITLYIILELEFLLDYYKYVDINSLYIYSF